MSYAHWMMVVAVLTTANIFWTFFLLMWGSKKVTESDCIKRRSECMGDREMARKTDGEYQVLTEIIKGLKSELSESKTQRGRLFDQTASAFSILSNLAMAIQIISAKLLEREPAVLDVVMNLLTKSKEAK